MNLNVYSQKRSRRGIDTSFKIEKENFFQLLFPAKTLKSSQIFMVTNSSCCSLIIIFHIKPCRQPEFNKREEVHQTFNQEDLIRLVTHHETGTFWWLKLQSLFFVCGWYRQLMIIFLLIINYYIKATRFRRWCCCRWCEKSLSR